MHVQPDYRPGSAYHRNRQRYAEAATRCLDGALELFGLPASLLDVGCGEGVQVGYCQVLGIDAWGVDLAIPDPSPTDRLRAWDLREPLDCGRVFDWVLCWEVAEHLPPAFAETLCDTLARHLARPHGRLLFTAARRGQSGPGHVNCQPLEFWRDRFAARAVQWLPTESARLSTVWRVMAPRAPWYGKNLGIYTWA